MDPKSFNRLVDTLPCVLYDYVRWPDGSCRFLYVSHRVQDLFGYSAQQAMDDAMVLWGAVHPNDLERLIAEDEQANKSEKRFDSEFRIVTPAGETKWLHLTSLPSDEMYESQRIWSGLMLDITSRKLAEQERERLIQMLSKANASVKVLSGLLPICLYCKKIRDDKGYWERVEKYLSRHTDATFSHGCCPDCEDKMYRDAET